MFGKKIVTDKYCFDLTFTDFHMHREKLDIILLNKYFKNNFNQKSKNVTNKSWTLIFIFFNIFFSDLKVRFRHFLTTNVKVSEIQKQKKYLSPYDFLSKIFSLLTLVLITPPPGSR